MKVIVYGDIHGCLEEFIALRNKLSISKDDFEISVGDLINKGPFSKETLDYVIENKISAVLGNNEEKFLKFSGWIHRKKGRVELSEKQRDLFLSLRDKHREFLSSLPYYIKVINLTILHGGLWRGARLSKLDRGHMSMIAHTRYLDINGRFIDLTQKDRRASFWSDVYDGSEGFVLYGHQVFKDPKIDRYSIGLDTGCVYGGHLSAAVIPLKGDSFDTKSIEIVQQKAKRTYSSK